MIIAPRDVSILTPPGSKVGVLQGRPLLGVAEGVAVCPREHVSLCVRQPANGQKMIIAKGLMCDLGNPTRRMVCKPESLVSLVAGRQ